MNDSVGTSVIEMGFSET